MPIEQSFYGPWMHRTEARERVRDYYMTLTHYIEAKKFDSIGNDELRNVVLMAASPKLARRRSMEESIFWRSDWAMVRSAVIAQGISIFYQQNPLAYGDEQSRESLLKHVIDSGMSREIAVNIYAMAVKALNEPRVVFLGHENASDEEVNKRLRLVNKRYGNNWGLVHWMGRHSSWTIHDLAVVERRLVVYFGTPKERLINDQLSQLVGSAEHFILFNETGDWDVDGWAKVLKASGKHVEVVQPRTKLRTFASSNDVEGQPNGGQKKVGRPRVVTSERVAGLDQVEAPQQGLF